MVFDQPLADGSTLRLVGLDVGDRRIGVAVSDPTGYLASPVEVYRRRDGERDLQYMVDLVVEYEATGVVVGLPKNMNGSEGPQAEKTREFAGALGSRGLPVALWDERLSTVEATRRMTEQRRKPRGIQQRIDSEAAALILQSYLDYVRYKEGG
ncbi:MAG: Holliday junction resolvase RuvX [Chloroflexota bacterium]|nr:MAG: Holliday junction resolvase RuvX [Chloroflexota bacterium]